MHSDDILILFFIIVFGVTHIFHLSISKKKNWVKISLIHFSIQLSYSLFFWYNLINNGQGGTSLVWWFFWVITISIHWSASLIGILVKIKKKSRTKDT
jgi:hypothetical protein